MGYDIFCLTDEVVIGAKDAAAADAAIRALAKEKDATSNTFEGLVEELTGELFIAKAENGGWKILCPTDDYFRGLERADDLFRVLAPFLEGQEIHFEGEDHAEWKWCFKGGQVLQDDATKVFGDDHGKIAAFDQILEVLYPEGKFRTKFPRGTFDKIATIIRKEGYGPLAGLDDLEALAKAGG